jgi:hypothetical protein
MVMVRSFSKCPFWRWVGPLAVLLGLAAPLTAAEPRTLDELKAELLKQRAKVRSFYVHYRLDAEPLAPLDLLHQWRRLDLAAYAREDHIAFKGNKQYWRKVDFIAKDGPLPKTPSGDRTMGFNGQYAWCSAHSAPCDQYVKGSPENDLGFFQSEYLMSVGLRHPDQTVTEKTREAMGQRLWLLPDAFDRYAYRLSGRTERTDGSRCLVVEAHWQHPEDKQVTITDRIWLDLEHGLAVRRRDQLFNGQLGERWLTFRLDEIVPGYWLPKETCWKRAAPASALKEWAGKFVLAYRMTVRGWKVNDVPDSLFEIPAKRP